MTKEQIIDEYMERHMFRITPSLNINHLLQEWRLRDSTPLVELSRIAGIEIEALIQLECEQKGYGFGAYVKLLEHYGYQVYVKLPRKLEEKPKTFWERLRAHWKKA